MADNAYAIESTIEGHGRELYVAKRHGDQRRYIMALFELRAEAKETLEAEITRCVELTHHAILPVVDFFERDDALALVFEKVDGVTLQRVLEHVENSEEPLGDAAIFHIAANLFGALDAAHTARDRDDRVVPLVHAELGPHQIFVSWSGEVQLLGVGLSTLFRLASASQLEAPAAFPFIAPEIHYGGALTVRANVYSAAAIVWALLARRIPPTDGSTAPRLLDVRPDLDRAVVSALDQALAPSLVERRITAGALERIFAPLAPGGQEQLRWGIEVLRAIETFDESLFGLESLPPAKLSGVPSESMRPIVTIPPHDDVAFGSLPPPSSEAVPISILPPSEDELGEFPTLPPRPPPPRKR